MPDSRHFSILAIIFIAAAVFSVERARQTTFAESGGAVPTQIRAAAQTLVEGHLTKESVRAFSTLVTSIFLHGDGEHILYNMVFLWTFGILTSELLGQWRTLAAFLICGICGAIVHVCLNANSSAPMIGASGAICGLEGIYLGLALRWELPYAEVWPLAQPVHPLQVGLFGILGFVGDLLLFANHDQHIAYGAHLGGFLSGVAIAAVTTTIYPTLAAYDQPSRKHRV